jgi:sugar/nucleoside kinase (ribokinase family)
MKQLDILAIGDIAIDVFIKIKEAEAVCDIHGEHCKLCLNYGGKIPYESVEKCSATGNSSNAAISISRLGLKSALMTNIGNDQAGNDCFDVLKKENVDTNFVKIEDGLPTNCHYVLWYNKERTILTKHEKYNYEWTNTDESKEYQAPIWIYLSSLGENSLRFHDEIVNYLKRHIKVKLAFQPGTFQLKLGYESLKEIYQRTDLFLCNREEAEKILNIENKDLPSGRMDVKDLLKNIYDLGPKIIVITDGLDGAYSYDGNEVLFMKAFSQNPVESTGAGDAFSSAFLAALSLGKEISDALIWGATNAMSVVKYIGPQKGLMTKNEIEEYIKNIPPDFNPIKLD